MQGELRGIEYYSRAPVNTPQPWFCSLYGVNHLTEWFFAKGAHSIKELRIRRRGYSPRNTIRAGGAPVEILSGVGYASETVAGLKEAGVVRTDD
jgi:hypothetical protein